MELIELNREQGKRLFEERMYQDFPADEIKPWPVIANLCRRGIYRMYGAFDGGKLVGYAWLVCPGGEGVLLDYLAVLPDLRGQGIGERILRQLRQIFRHNVLMLESEYPPEAPDAEMAQRRLGFYSRCGFRSTGVQLRLFGVRFCILTGGTPADPMAVLDPIYAAMFPGDGKARAVAYIK